MVTCSLRSEEGSRAPALWSGVSLSPASPSLLHATPTETCILPMGASQPEPRHPCLEGASPLVPH